MQHQPQQCPEGTAWALQKLAAFATFVLFHSLCIALPVGDTHLGIAPTFFVATNLCLLGNHVLNKLLPADLDSTFVESMIPGTLAKLMVSFNVGVIAISVLSRLLGPGMLMAAPAFLACLEFATTKLAYWNFLDCMALRPEARAAFEGALPAAVPSMIIALAHALAEAGRLALAMSSAATTQTSTMLMPLLGTTLALNLAIRLEWLPRCLHRVSYQKFCASNATRLLLLVRFQLGYPRFFTVAAVVAARLLLGHSAAPSAAMALVPMAFLAEELLEDLLVWALRRVGLSTQTPFAAVRAGPKQQGEAARFDGVQPDGREASGAPPAQGHDHAPAQREIYEDTPQPSFSELPFWCHCFIVHTSQFQFLFLLAVFGSGVSYLLGLCDEPGYRGYDRGILLWPHFDREAPCN